MTALVFTWVAWLAWVWLAAVFAVAWRPVRGQWRGEPTNLEDPTSFPFRGGDETSFGWARALPTAWLAGIAFLACILFLGLAERVPLPWSNALRIVALVCAALAGLFLVLMAARFFARPSLLIAPHLRRPHDGLRG